MEHVVFYSEESGQSEFRRVGDLEAAVRLVETLRNERGIADVTVHALTPVPVSFKTYYRVEVAAAAPQSASAADEGQDPSDEVPALAVPRLADEPSATPVLLAVPALLEDAPDLDDAGDDVPELRDDEAATVSYGTLTSLSYEPVESYNAVEGYDPVESYEPAERQDGADGDDTAFEAEPLGLQGSDEAEEFADHDVVVPQSRPEAQAERSLGYFAR